MKIKLYLNGDKDNCNMAEVTSVHECRDIINTITQIRDLYRKFPDLDFTKKEPYVKINKEKYTLKQAIEALLDEFDKDSNKSYDKKKKNKKGKKKSGNGKDKKKSYVSDYYNDNKKEKSGKNSKKKKKKNASKNKSKDKYGSYNSGSGRFNSAQTVSDDTTMRFETPKYRSSDGNKTIKIHRFDMR